ncbi:MAG: DNA-processing protein DprA [Desulfobacterales bacterium]
MRETPPEKLFPWFALKSIPGIGNILYKRLLNRYFSPENVFAASAEELVKITGISGKIALKIKTCKFKDDLKKEIDDILAQGFHIITFSDKNYPVMLRHIPDPPPYLYVSGKILPESHNIAVVGSRNPTIYGISEAKRLSGSLVKLGFTVISGMARGIDSAAHKGALLAEGNTVAVLGSGLGRIYPPENRKLFEEISERGAVVSEFSLNSPPEAHHFPIRNRIISGMSFGTVVVEAAKKSGSLITARLALEQNREVFAVPGSIQSFKSAGTNSLIKQGAKLVEHARDIIEELSPQMQENLEPMPHDGYFENKEEKLPELDPDEKHVINCLEVYPVHIDELVRKTCIAPGRLLSILLKFELEGFAKQSGGKCFSLKRGIDIQLE